MSYDLAVFASVNLANKMKSHLNKNGLYFGMLRAPHCIASGGCSFALRFEESKIDLVKEAALELDISIEGIYQEQVQENGERIYVKIE
jgi:hypothetical protein